MNEYEAKSREMGDYFTQLSLGNIPNAFRVYKFGRAVLQGGDNMMPITDLDGQYTFPTAGGILQVASDNPADVATSGAGAWTVVVEGLDADKNLITEKFSLNGAASIDGSKEFWRIFRAYVHQSGTSDFPYNGDVGNNEGTITITHPQAGVVAKIKPKMGQTLMAIYTVPKDHVALVWSADTNMGRDGDAEGMFFIRDTSYPNAPWRCQGVRDMYRNQVGKEWTLPGRLTEGMDIVMAASGGLNDTVSGTFELEVRRIR